MSSLSHLWSSSMTLAASLFFFFHILKLIWTIIIYDYHALQMEWLCFTILDTEGNSSLLLLCIYRRLVFSCWYLSDRSWAWADELRALVRLCLQLPGFLLMLLSVLLLVLGACCMQMPQKRKVCRFQQFDLSFWFWKDFSVQVWHLHSGNTCSLSKLYLSVPNWQWKIWKHSGEGRVNESEMLTHASLHSDPTLAKQSSSAWHEAARIWVQGNDMGNVLLGVKPKKHILRISVKPKTNVNHSVTLTALKRHRFKL